MCIELWQENNCARFFFLMKLQLGALQLYLNETLAEVPSCEFCLVSRSNYLQKRYKRLFLLFSLKFYFFLSDQLQGSEDQRFSHYVDVNQFNKNTTKFHVMRRDIYLHNGTGLGLLLQLHSVYSFSCII